MEETVNELVENTLKRSDAKEIIVNRILKYEMMLLRKDEIVQEAIDYIWSTKNEYGDLEEDNENFDIDVYELLRILEKERK